MLCVKETPLISITCGSIDFAISECGLVEVKLLIKNVNLTYVFSYKNTYCVKEAPFIFITCALHLECGLIEASCMQD